MWVVLNQNEEPVAWITDEVEADCFQTVYYPAGRVVWRRVSITVEEDKG